MYINIGLNKPQIRIPQIVIDISLPLGKEKGRSGGKYYETEIGECLNCALQKMLDDGKNKIIMTDPDIYNI